MPRGIPKSNAVLEQVREDINSLQADLDAKAEELATISIRLEAKREAYSLIEKALTRERPKSQPAPAAATRSPRKSKKDESPVNIETEKETVSPVGVCAAEGCGQESQYAIHHETSLAGYHPFQKTKRRKNQEPVVLPDNPEEFQHEKAMVAS